MVSCCVDFWKKHFPSTQMSWGKKQWEIQEEPMVLVLASTIFPSKCRSQGKWQQKKNEQWSRSLAAGRLGCHHHLLRASSSWRSEADIKGHRRDFRRPRPHRKPISIGQMRMTQKCSTPEERRSRTTESEEAVALSSWQRSRRRR